MKHFYLDQSITNKICEDIIFSTTFYQKHIIGQRQLATTPFCLIEFCGCLVKECLKPNTPEYSINRSDSFFAEFLEARKHYKNSIQPNILQYLENYLEQKRKPRTRTSSGMQIYRHYKNYLSDLQREEEVVFYISNDRAFALLWERFETENTYADIFNVISQFLALNPYIPCLRLILKSIRILPVSNDTTIEETRKMLICMIKKADIKQNKDLVDTELIQVAIMGYGNKPLHIYTMDSSKQIKIRLHIAYLLLKIIIQEAKDTLHDLGVGYKNVDEINLDEIQGLQIFNINDNNEGKKLKLKLLQRIACREFRFGKISIINDSGYIKENIKVKQCLSKTLELQ